MASSSDTDTYRWIKEKGTWRLESTSESGEKTLLPEGVVPVRAPCRFDDVPDYGKWKLKTEGFKDSGVEVEAR